MIRNFLFPNKVIFCLLEALASVSQHFPDHLGAGALEVLEVLSGTCGHWPHRTWFADVVSPFEVLVVWICTVASRRSLDTGNKSS